MKRIDYKCGDVVGNATFIKDSQMKVHPSGSKHRYAFFKCHCGNEFEAYVYHVRAMKINSCGCTKSDNAIKALTTHGKTNHKLYSVYRGMLDRTEYPSSKSYNSYGGRGIKICDEWRNSFMSFYTWSMQNGYNDGLQIDRIDNDGNYEPSNCRWTVKYVQAQNTRLINSRNKSGYRGVSLYEKEKYIARIEAYGRGYFLGLFDDPKHAAMAYDTFVIVYGTHHARNFA